jgi:hypothetical protein
MELHMQLISEHLSGAFDYLETTVREQYYGTKSEHLSKPRRLGGAGAPVTTCRPLRVHRTTIR